MSCAKVVQMQPAPRRGLKLALAPIENTMPAGPTTGRPWTHRANMPSPLPLPPLTAIEPGRLSTRHRSSSSMAAASRGGNVSEILPNRLYISDLSFAESASHLSSHGITHVVSTLHDHVSLPSSPGSDVDLQHLHVRIEDLPFAELVSHLPRTSRFISDALSSSPDARVLVHCHEGISRSASVVAAFLMCHFGWTPQNALAYVKSKRKQADPNFGFIQQLHEYARDTLGQKGTQLPSAADYFPPPPALPTSAVMAS